MRPRLRPFHPAAWLAVLLIASAPVITPPTEATAAPLPRLPPVLVRDVDPMLSMPYRATPDWWIGTTHVHVADHAELPLDATLARYRQLNHSFFFLTEHDVVRPAPAPGTDVSVLPGTEWSSANGGRASHMVALGLESTIPFKGLAHQDLVDQARAHGALPVLAHPNWTCARCTGPSWSVQDALDLDGYWGIEVYNTGMEARKDRPAWALDRWFAVLSAGRSVWAVAVDDGHRAHELGHGFIVVQAPGPTRPDIMAALAAGRFVAVHAPQPGHVDAWPREVRLAAGTVHVASDPDRPATRIEFYDARGTLRDAADASAHTYAVSGDEGSVVIILRGGAGGTTILQPVHVPAATAVVHPVRSAPATGTPALLP